MSLYSPVRLSRQNTFWTPSGSPSTSGGSLLPQLAAAPLLAPAELCPSVSTPFDRSAEKKIAEVQAMDPESRVESLGDTDSVTQPLVFRVERS